MKKQGRTSRSKKIDSMRLICWFVIPLVTVVGLVADTLGIFQFTNKNLIVIGACLVVVLLPFFSEIKIKDISVKRNRSGADTNT